VGGEGRRKVTCFGEEEEGMELVFFKDKKEKFGNRRRAASDWRTGQNCVGRNMGWLETVDGNMICSGTHLEEKGMRIALKNFVGTIVGWSQWWMGRGRLHKNE
jgi:hypothetical protein